MDRRTYLAGFATGILGLAGCLGGSTRYAPGGSISEDSSGSKHDWPTFGHDFANTGFNPDTSGPVEDVQIEWEVGTGTPTALSSPIVIGETVIASGTGDPGGLLALDIADGTEQWRLTPEGYVVATPTVVDGALYVGGWSGRFYAIDITDGSEHWHVDFPARFGHSSPVVVDGTVYAGTLGYEPLTVSAGSDPNVTSGRVVALDAETGERRWQYGKFGEHERIDTSPAIGGGRIYAASDKGSFVALDAETGDELWRRTFRRGDHGLHLSAPTFADDAVYVTVGDGLVAFDAAGGEIRWRTELQAGGGKSSPAFAEGTVYVVSAGTRCPEDDPDCGMDVIDVAYIQAVDASDGAVQWTYESKQHGSQSSPAVTDDVVYVGVDGYGEDLANGVIAIDRTDGTEHWSLNLGEDGPALFSSPAVSDGRVFIEAPNGRVVTIGGR